MVPHYSSLSDAAILRPQKKKKKNFNFLSHMNKQQTTALLAVCLSLYQEKSDIISHSIVADTSNYPLHSTEKLLDRY